MASCGIKLVGTVKYLPSGGSEVLRQSGVVSLLRQQAEKDAARCNSIAGLHNASIRPRYAAEPKNVNYFEGYLVKCDNTEAYIDNLRNNTLKKGCGI